MAMRTTVTTVFGGSGFIGRHVVKRLAAAGHVVRVAVRDPEAALFLKPMGAVGQIVPLYAPVTEEADVAAALVGADNAINLVGILFERRKGGFQAVHAEGATRIARLAAEAGVKRLVHVSAIGADPASPSLYARSKAEGEAGVRAAFPAATILRPSIVFGPEDSFLNRFGAMAALSPILPLIHGGTRFQPVYVGDVADAAMAALTRGDAPGKTYELGGPRVWSFEELLRFVLQQTHRRRRLVAVPTWLARFQARFMECLPNPPLTRDQLLQLARDNVVAPGAATLTDLGIRPQPLEAVAPSYLARFRPGGGKRDPLAA